MLINNNYFFKDVSTPEISSPINNVKSNLLILEVSGDATSFSVSVLGSIDLQNENYTQLNILNMSDYSLNSNINSIGIYEVDISAIQNVKLQINSISGGNISVLGIFKED